MRRSFNDGGSLPPNSKELAPGLVGVYRDDGSTKSVAIQTKNQLNDVTATTSREELSTSTLTSVPAGPVHESMVQAVDDMAPGVDDIVEHVGPTSKDTKYLDILRKTRGVASGLAIVVGEPLTDLSALLELKDHFGRAVAGKGVRDFHRAIRRAREYGQNVWGFVNGDSEAIMEAVLPRCYKDRVKFRMRRMPIPINPDCMQGGFTALHRAACDGSVRKTKFVLASGGDVNKLCEVRRETVSCGC